MTPDGRTIHVPNTAFRKLRQLNLLQGNRAQLSTLIYDYLRPEFDSLTQGLRRILGTDLSGPAWPVCDGRCRKCRRILEDADKTATPFPVGRR